VWKPKPSNETKEFDTEISTENERGSPALITNLRRISATGTPSVVRPHPFRAAASVAPVRFAVRLALVAPFKAPSSLFGSLVVPRAHHRTSGASAVVSVAVDPAAHTHWWTVSQGPSVGTVAGLRLEIVPACAHVSVLIHVRP
jgi:hypothetical protein